jgi:hypothetical protein
MKTRLKPVLLPPLSPTLTGATREPRSAQPEPLEDFGEGPAANPVSKCWTGFALMLAVAAAQGQAPGSALGQPRSLATPNVMLPPLAAASAARASTPAVRELGVAIGAPRGSAPALPGPPLGTQRPATPPVAGPTSAAAIVAEGGVTRPASMPGVRPGAQAAAQGKPVVKQVLSSPRRTQLINEQLTLRTQENALAKQAHSLAAGPVSAAAGPPSITRAAALSAAAGVTAGSQRLEPGIANVNRKTSGALLTPGGYITISGRGFGQTLGQVNAVGRFPNGELAYKVIEWRDDQIHALLPEGVRGVPDQGATLQVVTRGGKTWSAPGMRFVATRAEIMLTSGQRVFDVRPAADWLPQVGPDGWVLRSETGEKLICKRPGADLYRLKPMPPGWEVSALGVAHAPFVVGGAGETPGGQVTFAPGYELWEWSGDRIIVKWGVVRTHRSPFLGVRGGDECESGYQLQVHVVGPAGLTPY